MCSQSLLDSYALVLAGGIGTRLWPLSRKNFPKQLISLVGNTSLLQSTVVRLSDLFESSHIWTITNDQQIYEVKGQLSEIHCELPSRVYGEPVSKDTLPAIAWMVWKIFNESRKKDRDAIISVFPSDHLIQNQEKFIDNLKTAENMALQGFMVLLGIIPDHPSTDYGYIRTGNPIKEALEVIEFKEKPNRETAKQYLEEGNFFWNGGMFVFKASVFLDALKSHQPDLYQLLEKWGSGGFEQVLELFEKSPKISIDYGLIEKMDKIAVVPAQFTWSDLGGWKALYDHLPKDASGNAIKGDVVGCDNQDSLFWAQEGTLVTVGLKDVVVVRVNDATLVCSMDHLGKLKNVIQSMQINRSSTEGLMIDHGKTTRPWGVFHVLHEEQGCKLKSIEVKPGESLSKQYHDHREEHWVVIEGEALVEIDEQVTTLKSGDYVFIGLKQTHRLSNPSDSKMLRLIEVQRGEKVDEDDIVRLEDRYARAVV